MAFHSVGAESEINQKQLHSFILVYMTARRSRIPIPIRTASGGISPVGPADSGLWTLVLRTLGTHTHFPRWLFVHLLWQIYCHRATPAAFQVNNSVTLPGRN